ncbi:predicted protein [Naegleria gruberi]|uniref:Predicted protein n=1 Tax=Naegleria gruberi TaxID=5762 RepID=D2V5Z5_NAEGR|nr:uncharacterized protein NAEGRDRAFT_64255 [Naegleria gruberi]EFC47733.1 predicted protein [Naegleria gruberi]|eukprot:XP_002680477.1 predicted protein [Naegleria gruberi strain NEG-M]
MHENNEGNPFLNLSSDLHCYICSFLLGELFNNYQERNEQKLKFSTTRKSHRWFQNGKSSNISTNSSVGRFLNFPSLNNDHDGHQRFYLNSPLKLNGMMMLFSLKNTCRRMFEFVSESEELWHSILISFPISLGFKSGHEKSWMMNMNLEGYYLLDGDGIDVIQRENMVADVLNILFLLNKLCHVKRVIKRISIDFTMKSLYSDMNSRLELLNISQINGESPALSFMSYIFKSLEELILLPNNEDNQSMALDLSLKHPFKKLKHLVIDAELAYCLDFIKYHIATLENITFVNKGNNFRIINNIMVGLLNRGIIESEILESVEFVGTVDLRYIATVQMEYVKKYGANATKYLSKIKNLSIFQFTNEAELGHESNQILLSNMVELTLVQYQGGDFLDLSNMDFPNLKILNMKGCMQTLNLKGMDARSLESLQLRMFDMSGTVPLFHTLKYLTIDNCKGIDANSWFNNHENLKEFRIIPNKLDSSLDSMEMVLSGHPSITCISVTACDNVTIFQCKNLEEVHLLDCKLSTISTNFGEFCRGLKILEIENTLNPSSIAHLDISYCYYAEFRTFKIIFDRILRVNHLNINSSYLFNSIADNLEISNIYIENQLTEEICSIVRKAKVSNNFGITHLSKEFRPKRQFECRSNNETLNIVSNTLKSDTETFDHIENFLYSKTCSPADFGNMSFLCYDGDYSDRLLKSQTNSLFRNIVYLSISSYVSEIELDLNSMVNLKELYSSSHKVSLEAKNITHQSLRSLVLLNHSKISITFSELKAPKLMHFFISSNTRSGSFNLDERQENTQKVEIVNCEFPSLIFHSPIVKDEFLNEKVKSLNNLLKGFSRIEKSTANSSKNFCKLM